MADTILVVAEQREGKLNRVSLETLAGAQAIAKQTGWAVEVVLPGAGVEGMAQELAGKTSGKVVALEADALQAYTSDAYVSALKPFIQQKQPKLVLFPHTYQVRDFAPRLALALDRTLISDATGYKYENGQLLFTRQMFQGKFAADVSFGGDAPWMATLQIGAFRGDQRCGRGRLASAAHGHRGPWAIGVHGALLRRLPDTGRTHVPPRAFRCGR